MKNYPYTRLNTFLLPNSNHGWLMQGGLFMICLFCGAWSIRNWVWRCCLPMLPPAWLSVQPGTQKELFLYFFFRSAPNWHQEIYGPNEFNKLSQGPVWHSGSVLPSTLTMSLVFNMSALWQESLWMFSRQKWGRLHISSCVAAFTGELLDSFSPTTAKSIVLKEQLVKYIAL